MTGGKNGKRVVLGCKGSVFGCFVFSLLFNVLSLALSFFRVLVLRSFCAKVSSSSVSQFFALFLRCGLLSRFVIFCFLFFGGCCYFRVCSCLYLHHPLHHLLLLLHCRDTQFCRCFSRCSLMSAFVVFLGGGSKVNFISLFSWLPRVVLGLCVELLWLLCFYLHVQCLFVAFNVFSGNC